MPFDSKLAIACLALVCLLALPAAGQAAKFPPITDQEKALTEMPGDPSIPAVILFKNGNIQLMGTRGQAAYSSMEVEVRTKILKEEGESYGEVEIFHSGFTRLVSFEGRTVLPDGRVIPVPEDSIFERTMSGQKKWYVTSVAFPNVEPGAILDYRYEMRFESIYTLDPWYFQDEIPTLHSEVVYQLPNILSGRAWWQSTTGKDVQSQTRPTAQGNEVRAWMDYLPGFPTEEAAMPASDLSSRFMVVPTKYIRDPLLADWKSASNLIDYTYQDLRRRDRDVKRQAKEIHRPLDGDEAKARALFEFVRDEVETLPFLAVYAKTANNLDEVLEERQGSLAEKALMLETMLDEAGLKPDLIWAPERSDGLVDMSVANPNWFERVLVRLELDGETVYLDPSGSAYPFGYLSYDLEGMPAVVYDIKKPEVIDLPEQPFDANLRRAELDLEVGDDGVVSGTGRLVATGHHGVIYRSVGDTDEERLDWWREDLEEDFPAFEISDIAVGGDPETARVEVTWSLAQRADEALGDEVSLDPSRPLGPISQHYVIPPASRYSPVLIPFGDRDEVVLDLTWPAGWSVDLLPEETELTNDAGAYRVTVERGEDGRSVTTTRRFDTHDKMYIGRDRYTALRNLYGAVHTGDRDVLVLLQDGEAGALE